MGDSMKREKNLLYHKATLRNILKASAVALNKLIPTSSLYLSLKLDNSQIFFPSLNIVEK